MNDDDDGDDDGGVDDDNFIQCFIFIFSMFHFLSRALHFSGKFQSARLKGSSFLYKPFQNGKSERVFGDM